MPDPNAEFAAIIKRRDEASAKLTEIEIPEHARANDLINKKNRGVELTPAEKEELDEKHMLLGKLSHAKSIVGQIAIQEMNNSALLRDIQSQLEGISADLKETKAKLKKIGKVGKALADGAELLATLAKEVGDKGKGAGALLT
jgi:hypothetical protein